MTALARVPGKYGRLPRDLTRHAPVFEDYFTPGLPEPPHQDVDRCSQVTNWPMYQNDTVGDCTVAGIFHCIGAMSVYAGHPEVLFTDDEAIKVYSAVSGYVPGDPSTDNGATLQSVLQYGHDTGFVDATGKTHTVDAYASMRDPNHQDSLARALWTFGACYAGGMLPQSAEQEFPGEWTWVPGSPDAGGHCTSFQRRGFGGTGVDRFISWGAAVEASEAFTWNYLDPRNGGECWVLATQDWVEASGTTPTGLTVAAWLADMQDVR